MTEERSYEDEDSDLMLEIVDRANDGGLSQQEMQIALQEALTDSVNVEEHLQELCEFFRRKIHEEGIAANRLQRLIRDVVMVPNIMKKVEKMEGVLRSLARCAGVICPNTVDSSKKLCAVSTLINEIAVNLCETYGANAILQLAPDHVQTFTIVLQPENEQGMECTYSFITKEDSPIGYSSISDEVLLVFRRV